MADPVTLTGHAGKLAGSLSLPLGSERAAAVVLCHGFPSAPRGARSSGEGYPELADHLAAETGAAVLTLTFRGCGTSEGDFSLGGWVDDLHVAVEWLSGARGVAEIAVAGFSVGGAVALCAAAADTRIGAVACFAAPAGLEDWIAAPQQLLDRCRELGAIRTRGYPRDMAAWTAELSACEPRRAMAALGSRRVLLVQGTEDDVVNADAPRELAAAQGEGDGEGGTVDVRMLVGAGHRLRHDPRSIAVLIGWILRQGAR